MQVGNAGFVGNAGQRLAGFPHHTGEPFALLQANLLFRRTLSRSRRCQMPIPVENESDRSMHLCVKGCGRQHCS
jgi:hypothetical protein